MAAGDPIHIVLSFDDGYWAPAYAVMRSACLFTLRRRDLVFHLLHQPLAPGHMADLRRIEAEFGATLCLYNLVDDPGVTKLLADSRHAAKLSTAIYARMLIEVILPPEIERVLYIDCDTMVNAPIERLAEMDLQGHAIGAARDFIGSEIATQRDMIDARGLFDTGHGYFNSGMMLIDMAGWRRARVIDRLRGAIADGTMKKLYLDQDLLNLIFAGDWLQIDPRWNFTGARPIHEILDPWLLHYVGTHKPWHLKPNLAFARRYRHVMTNALYYRYLRFRWQRRPRSAWREIIDMLLRR